MQEGWSPCLKIPNVPITFSKEEFGLEESWTPENSGEEFNGLVLSVKFGLANSINCMTAYVMKQFGPEAVINIARKMGITSPLDPYPALCLGTSDVSVYEMVGAYSTFANIGVWVEPLIVTKIEDNKGNLLKDFIPQKQEAMSEQTVSLMLNMLMGVVDGVYSPEAEKRIGTAVRLRFKYKMANEIAGKTGTTQNYSDGWFMGVTPNLTTGVWVGCDDRSVHFRYMKYGQGANMALPIWALYMKKVYENEELGISPKDVFDRLSGKRLGIETNCANYVETGEENSEENFDN
jgi:penicillin-binding protein 1A